MKEELPEAYRLGWVPFLGAEIGLASRPLIPRVETEWWAEQLIARLKARSGGLRILDLCAGSGAIGCALLKHLPGARVAFGELEPAHEATIRENLRRNGLDGPPGRTAIRIGDLFAPFAGERFDVVAANPPYIPAGRALPSSVADYEPARALYAGADGLALIRRIARALPAHLAPGGEAWVECDSAHAEAARACFAAAGLRARVLPDQYGRPRVIVVSWPR
jgi:release factor glutamine methyltransferase